MGQGVEDHLSTILICLSFLCSAVSGVEVMNVEKRSGASLWLSCQSPLDEQHELQWLKSDSIGTNITLLQFTLDLLEPDWSTDSNVELGRLEFESRNLSLHIKNTLFRDQGEYTCQLIPINSTDTTPFYEQKTNLEVFDPPDPPGQPILTILNATSATASWQPSQYNGNSVVSSYTIYLRRNDEEEAEELEIIDIPSTQSSWPLHDLHPYTYYEFDMAAKNRAGFSGRSSKSDLKQTHEAVPSAEPRIKNIKNFTNSLVVEFGPCPIAKLNGKLLGYILTWSPQDGSAGLMMTDIRNATSYNITKLEADTIYDIHLKMYNQAGNSPSVAVLVRTNEGVPGPPRIISVRNQTSTSLQVDWEKPAKPNGQIHGYFLYTETGTSKKRRDIPVQGTANKGMNSYVITDLEPYQEYKIEVIGYTSKGEGERSESRKGVTDLAGPGPPTIVNGTLNDTTAIILEWTRPVKVVKQIDMYSVRFRILGFPTWNIRNFTVTVDDEQHSGEITLLESGSRYEFEVAGGTHSMFNDNLFYIGVYSDVYIMDTPVVGVSTTPMPGHKANFSVGIIAGLVCTALLLLVAVLVFLVMRRVLKARYQFIADPESTKLTSTIVALPDCYDESEHNSIQVDRFEEHVNNNHSDGDLLFSQEYDEINQATKDLSTSQSSDTENRSKNRYINIMAYDHSRVMLRPLQGQPKSDYINANFVDGYHKPQAYIAAQGPLPSTFADFWRMIWEQQSAVIVMITNLWEKGRRKCDQYWPSDTEQQYGTISVHLESTDIFAHCTLRVFTIRNNKVKKRGDRTVYQYHYTDWPDHGVPDYTLPVLTFVRKSVAANPPSAGPPIVHCSAGVGRTGTYIVVDAMMRQIKEKNSVSVFGFLSHIRNHRNYLVQTEEQYVFIHDVLLEYIQSGNTEVRDSALAAYVEELEAEVDTSGISGLEKQYKLATCHEPEDYDMQSAMLPANIEKNRSKIILPVDASRVRLPMKAGVEGSDYINASFFQGYYKNEEYVVTQHPHRSTVEDFWHMVWDQNSMTMVLLSPTDKEEYAQFWPDKDETMDCGHFKVTFNEENHQLGQVTRDFLLQSTQDDYECTARMISTTCWPESCSPLPTVFELIQSVRTWHQQHEEVEGPIIVLDRFGGVEASTFCALYTLHEQMQRENTVDVYMVAKLYHLKRPGIFAKQENYAFLYKALMSICKDKRDSGIGNCSNFPATLPNAVSRSTSRHSTSNPDSRTTTTTM